MIAYLPEQHAPDHALIGRAVVDEQRAFMTVAAMISNQSPAARAHDLQAAVEPIPSNLGASLAKGVAMKVYTSEGGLHRLILLSRQNVDGIHRLLPSTIEHLRNKGISIDWVPLIGDLADWRRRRRDIARWWIQDYSRTLYRFDTDKHRTDSTAESETL